MMQHLYDLGSEDGVRHLITQCHGWQDERNEILYEIESVQVEVVV